MILSRQSLSLIDKENLILPPLSVFDLPEKVLQFGTGVLLRGLPDYFIDKANRQGIFNGRVAVVKSTEGSTADFDTQDALYTLCVRGIEAGAPVTENIISSAISRVLSAKDDWEAILAIADTADLQLVISNTTELGIQYQEEPIGPASPSSFPAKLLAVLYRRFNTFKGATNKGLVIVPTELIPDNGTKLKDVVLQLAAFNQLSADFVNWLEGANTFCNSLVDRIVPGKPDAATLAALQTELGYEDNLLCTTEPYRLWAIEGNKQVAEVLSFAQVDSGVIITEDIEIYKELKVRLLNGTHTLTSGLAYLAGIDTVKNAMSNDTISHFIEELMFTEIAPAIPYAVTEAQTTAFANAVKDRFANPSIEHLWLNITFQYSMKMKVRVLPLLLNYYKIFKQVPAHIALGFAAYLLFMRIDKQLADKYFGNYQGNTYAINDESAEYFAEKSKLSGDAYVENILADTSFWGADLTALPGFVAAVAQHYQNFSARGILQVLGSGQKINLTE